MIKVKVIIPIIIIIIIIIAGAIITFTPNEETSKNKIEEEWIKSGPFSIDKSEYNVGEKIFISVNGLKEEDKGQVIFFRPTASVTNSGTMFQTSDIGMKDYIKMDFDGKDKIQFNLYFEPALNKIKGICSINDLAGNWIVEFAGTQYQDINFEILNQTSSWDNRIFEPVC
tara:strand:+ start:115 stop:624 length:510 start_codon:yes stop_codon:yes gene_type:complete